MRAIDNPNVHTELNKLARSPEWGSAVMTRKQAKQMLLETGGNMMACGRLYDFKLTALGAGVVRVTLKPWKHSP